MIFLLFAIPLVLWLAIDLVRCSIRDDRERREHRRWGGTAPRK